LNEDKSAKIDGTAITLTLPNGTAITNLKPTIAYKGKSISPSSGTAQDFTKTVTYTVKVSLALATDKEITSFVFYKKWQFSIEWRPNSQNKRNRYYP